MNVENTIPIADPFLDAREDTEGRLAKLIGATVQDHVNDMIHAEANDIYVKQMPLGKIGNGVQQHNHEYEHLTLLAMGAVAVRIENRVACYEAPTILRIRAGISHGIVALRDGTVCYCIHNTRDMERVEDLIRKEG